MLTVSPTSQTVDPLPSSPPVANSAVLTLIDDKRLRLVERRREHNLAGRKELVKVVELVHVLETLASVAGLLCVEMGIRRG